MKNREFHPASSSVPVRPRAGHFKLGLWVRLSIASLWSVLAGLAMLVDAKAGSPAYGALAAVVGGAAIGLFSWRRVGAISETLDVPATGTAAAAPVAQARGKLRTPLAPQAQFPSPLRR